VSATPGLRRVRERARANVLLDNLWRVGVAISGLLVVALGLVLVPLPGPGWAIVAVGVLIWATEFKWARGLLDRLRFALSTSKKVVTHPRLRLFWSIFSLVLGIAFIVVLTWYLVEFGFSLDGVSAFQGWVIDRISASRWGSIFGFSGD
jgi:uncharacterized protein (TIGR02611 family)